MAAIFFVTFEKTLSTRKTKLVQCPYKLVTVPTLLVDYNDYHDIVSPTSGYKM